MCSPDVPALHNAQAVQVGKRARTIASPPDRQQFAERLETLRFKNRPEAKGFTDSCCFQLSNRKSRAGFRIQDFQPLFLIETSTPALINCRAWGHRPWPGSPKTETCDRPWTAAMRQDAAAARTLKTLARPRLASLQAISGPGRDTLNNVNKNQNLLPNIHNVKRCYFSRSVLVRIVFISETMKKINQ
ncbi:hypothetical protein F3J24_12080 [Comamonas sp. Tr-654]|uniref:hypothetical protein n=1 Tax=Comamonas sp. Tr-654 TaxID=2608341 RepID=UPI00196309DA|nr:hypothetical protein [Comamonas sp. Tr-654]NIF84234.1 hypothetical protein [Comamonas sp. Tr-654]